MIASSSSPLARLPSAPFIQTFIAHRNMTARLLLQFVDSIARLYVCGFSSTFPLTAPIVRVEVRRKTSARLRPFSSRCGRATNTRTAATDRTHSHRSAAASSRTIHERPSRGDDDTRASILSFFYLSPQVVSSLFRALFVHCSAMVLKKPPRAASPSYFCFSAFCVST